jgi:hypothetical protein
VSLDNQSLKITTGSRSLGEKTYHQMVANVCQDLRAYPEVAKLLKEIVFLSKWETQGWVFASPGNFNEILEASAGSRETVIAGYTREFKN